MPSMFWGAGSSRPLRGADLVGDLAQLVQPRAQTGPTTSEYLVSLGLPQEVADLFSNLNPTQARLAGLQYQGDEEARRRAEAANAMIDQMYQGRMDATDPLVQQATRAASENLNRPLVDEYLSKQLLDQQTGMIEQQRREAARRMEERYAARGMGDSGALEAERRTIDTGADEARRRASQDIGISQAVIGQAARERAISLAGGLGQQQQGRQDQLTGEHANLINQREFLAPDYSAAMAMGLGVPNATPGGGQFSLANAAALAQRNAGLSWGMPQGVQRAQPTGGQPGRLQHPQQQASGGYTRETMQQALNSVSGVPRLGATPSGQQGAPSGSYDGRHIGSGVGASAMPITNAAAGGANGYVGNGQPFTSYQTTQPANVQQGIDNLYRYTPVPAGMNRPLTDPRYSMINRAW